MAENGGDGLLSDEQRCKRSDGKKWRCRRPVMAGRTLCEAHFLQGRHRQHKEPVPDNLKLERQKPMKRFSRFRETPIGDHEIRANGDVGCSDLPPKGAKRKAKVEESVVFSNGSRKKGKTKRKEEKSSVDFSEKLDDALKKMNLKKGDLQLDLIRGCLNRQIEKKKEKQPKKEDIVKELKYGRLEISQSSPLSAPLPANNGGLKNVRVGVSQSSSAPRRFFRSKNIDPLPIATMQILPSIKANIKAASKRKCHWCRMSSYQVFVKCLACKKHFFCEDCIHRRNLDKEDVKKRCPVCRGTCSCRVCVRGRSKEVQIKDLVVYNGEDKKFDKVQQLLYTINLLLPLLEQMNQEKTTEMDIEARLRGKNYVQRQTHLPKDSQKWQCCFCKSCIVDVHRSCRNCSYVLCVPCCREFRNGHLHMGLRDFKFARNGKRESFSTILWGWETPENGTITCPPKNLGGCGGGGILELVSVSPFRWTHDLESTAQETVFNANFTNPSETDSPFCPLCDENDKNRAEKGVCFSTKRDFRERNLEHFTKHWVKGQPMVIGDVIGSGSELSWDPVFLFSTYLERSGKSQSEKSTAKPKNFSDWCKVEIGREQIIMGGKTHANVWREVVKFKVWLSSGFFREVFPAHYAAVIGALPLPEYFDPVSGVLNMAAKLPPESQSSDLGPFLYISYSQPLETDFLSKLCYHAYDTVNILVHATEQQISEKKLRNVKLLINKYSSDDHNEPPRTNKIDEQCGKSSFSSEITQQSELEDNTNGETYVFSDDSSIEDSDDNDLGPDEIESSRPRGAEPVDDTCGARWDVFRREDVPKLIEYLKKYSNELNQSQGSTKKVVHPILDESFYLDAFHKWNLKKECDIEPWTFEQHVGEAVIVPAGCPYQVKKIKSCVNVVVEFVSPESAAECIKLSDELRQLPVNHKAKGKMLEVKKMTVYSVNAAVEGIRKISQPKSTTKLGSEDLRGQSL